MAAGEGACALCDVCLSSPPGCWWAKGLSVLQRGCPPLNLHRTVSSEGKGNSVVAFLYLVIDQSWWDSTECVRPGGSKLWDWVVQEGKCRGLNPTHSSLQALLVSRAFLQAVLTS